MSRVEGAVRRSAKLIAPIGAALALGTAGVAATAALATPTAGTGTTGATGTTGTTGATGPTGPAATTVTTHHTKRGKVLAAANGHSLYLSSSDGLSRSKCSVTCAKTWKPLLTSAKPLAAAGSGVNAKLLGTTRRSAHSLQVTYRGHPLYQYAKDTRPGQIGGQAKKQFGGHWYLVNTRGRAVKPKGSSTCNPNTEYCPLGF